VRAQLLVITDQDEVLETRETSSGDRSLECFCCFFYNTNPRPESAE
jgi:hypothetical protein